MPWRFWRTSMPPEYQGKIYRAMGRRVAAEVSVPAGRTVYFTLLACFNSIQSRRLDRRFIYVHDAPLTERELKIHGKGSLQCLLRADVSGWKLVRRSEMQRLYEDLTVRMVEQRMEGRWTDMKRETIPWSARLEKQVQEEEHCRRTLRVTLSLHSMLLLYPEEESTDTSTPCSP